MRYSGKLKMWNNARGFGFIVAEDSGQDVFVHITAFPRDDRVPEEGELLSFEIEPDRKGKNSAVRVLRPYEEPLVTRRGLNTGARYAHKPHYKASMRTRVIIFCLLAALAQYAYTQYKKRTAPIWPISASPVTQPAPIRDAVAPPLRP